MICDEVHFETIVIMSPLTADGGDACPAAFLVSNGREESRASLPDREPPLGGSNPHDHFSLL